VDDSGFYRRRVSEILSADPSIQVVGTATNGKEAIDQAIALKPDVITMDYEMPMMDGITAVRHIMQRCPTPVLMFSSLTHEGARVTLDALDAGQWIFYRKTLKTCRATPRRSSKCCAKRFTASRAATVDCPATVLQHQWFQLLPRCLGLRPAVLCHPLRRLR